MIPKGETYVLKISPFHLDDEADAMRRASHIPYVVHSEMKLKPCYCDVIEIRCQWHCLPVQINIQTQRVTFVRGHYTYVPTTYDVLAIQYFDAPSLQDILTDLSLPIQPPESTDERADLFHRTDVQRALHIAKSTVLDFLKLGWIHKDLQVGHILYNQRTSEVKIIDLEFMENYVDVNRERYISPIEWMWHAGEDFRVFLLSFAVSILCPEEFTPFPGILEPHEINPASRDCPDHSDMTQIISEFEPDMNIIDEFINKAPPTRTLEDLPESLQKISRRLGRPSGVEEPIAPAVLPEPPAYNSVYPESSMQYTSLPSFSSAQGLSLNKHSVLPKSVLDIEGDQIPNVPLPSTSKQSTPTRHVQSELEAFLHGSDPDDVSCNKFIARP